MNDEAAFLEAIRGAPGDAAVRLVYADWLQENEDPRAELVRIEEEVRHLAVFGDRYWLLKPLRRELRSRSPQEWLTAMGYENDGPLLFAHGVPDGWRERWRLIREYTERWHGIPMPDVGGRADEIREVEERLGRVLPPSLREWVAFAHDAGKKDRDSGSHLVLGGIYNLADLHDQAAVEIFAENVAYREWAIRHDDFAFPDPPVTNYYLDFDDHYVFRMPSEQNPVAPTTTAFIFGRAATNFQAKGGGLCVRIDPPETLMADLTTAFPIRVDFDGCGYFESDGVLVRLSPAPGRFLTQLDVAVRRESSREVLPDCLWNLCGGSGSFYGVCASWREQTYGPDGIPF